MILVSPDQEPLPQHHLEDFQQHQNEVVLCITDRPLRISIYPLQNFRLSLQRIRRQYSEDRPEQRKSVLELLYMYM